MTTASLSFFLLSPENVFVILCHSVTDINLFAKKIIFYAHHLLALGLYFRYCKFAVGRLYVKAVLFNVSTCYAFFEMIEKNQTLTSRIVTISGDTITGHNVQVPIGTRVSELLERVPGAHTAQRIAWGGAMTGVAIKNLDVPIIKTTTAVTIIRKFEPPRTNCIHCGACVGACPVGLSPYLLNRLIELGETDMAIEESVQQCIACGACSYVCPAGIELSTNIAKAAYRARRGGAR